jgi:transposase, IS5 family
MAKLNQLNLLSQSTKAEIILKEDHPLVQITKLIDWDKFIELAMNVRESKIIKSTGPAPHYRELLGAVALMGIKNITYREAEDLIAHYAPARYLCDLMDSTWRPDHITIFDFTQMLGSEGMDIINTEVLNLAKEKGLLDPSVMMSDTTAQEARIPYPTEVGLMSKFTDAVSKQVKKVGSAFREVKTKIKEVVKKVKGMVRGYHLFAKTKEAKRKTSKKIYHTVKSIQRELEKVFQDYSPRSKAAKELGRITDVMKTLFPQIKHFLETGFVANKKIIHICMSELYSIVRGKAGKNVEFGLKWGVNRIGSGFLQGFLIQGGLHCSDKRFCREAVHLHQGTFGEVPKIYGFDRGGYSQSNIKKISKLGVKHVGIAPTGKADWTVSKSKQDFIKRERAQVEGGIGTIKSSRYGFNKPDVKSTPAMERSGHRSILGFNLQKLLRENQKMMLATT